MGPTSGPWDWFWNSETSNGAVVSISDDMPSALVCCAPKGTNAFRWEADARLMAASPVLLQAARVALLNYLRNLRDEDYREITFMGDDEHEAIKVLNEAIMLATGEHP